jgi:hypothetical protein
MANPQKIADKLAVSRRLNLMAALGFVILTLIVWTDDFNIIWKLIALAAAIFQIAETKRLYKK